MGRHEDFIVFILRGHGVGFVKAMPLKSTVIPGKAGSQSFSRVCGDMSLFLHAPRVKGWIPAFAGMTLL